MLLEEMVLFYSFLNCFEKKKNPETDKYLGCEIEYLEGQGCLPLKIKNNCLNGGHLDLSAKISSQYVSSILITAPYAKNPIELQLTGKEIVSEPYIEMTIKMMESKFLCNLIMKTNI